MRDDDTNNEILITNAAQDTPLPGHFVLIRVARTFSHKSVDVCVMTGLTNTKSCMHQPSVVVRLYEAVEAMNY